MDQADPGGCARLCGPVYRPAGTRAAPEVPAGHYAAVHRSTHRQRRHPIKTAGGHEADIGYELDSQHWGCGYASEAARALVQFGFEDLRLHRISAHCLAENIASARVLEKLGMRLEGRLRDSEHFKGRYWDTLHYAILDHEWQAQKP